MTADEKFDPKEMQSIVDKLKREGRMPSPEKFAAVIAESRKAYQEALEKDRAKKKSSRKTS